MNNKSDERVEKILKDLQNLVDSLLAIVTKEKHVNDMLKLKLDVIEKTVDEMSKKIDMVEKL